MGTLLQVNCIRKEFKDQESGEVEILRVSLTYPSFSSVCCKSCD